jgi:hypothetical protein
MLDAIDGGRRADMIGRWLRRLEERRRADERRRAAEAERRKQPAEGDPTDPLSALNPTHPTHPAWEVEAEARAINATGWEPPHGMVKRQCSWCRYVFAAPADSHEPRCPNCVKAGKPPRIRSEPAPR